MGGGKGGVTLGEIARGFGGMRREKVTMEEWERRKGAREEARRRMDDLINGRLRRNGSKEG
jgi:hypothetical protein